MRLYFDECFNTGNNWLDSNQPFFTYGGWLISDDNYEKAHQMMASFSAQYPKEIKSKDFTSFPKIAIVTALFEQFMTECDAKPYFVCMEKFYMIACKAVEIFFDHTTNKAVNGYLTFPNEDVFNCVKISNKINPLPIRLTKIGLSETIKNNGEFCEFFGSVLNSKNAGSEEVIQLIEKLKNLFADAGYHTISNVFKVENFDIEEICNELNPVIEHVGSATVTKSLLVQPCLYETIVSATNIDADITVFVDTLGQQNQQFAQAEQLLKRQIRIVADSSADVMIMASDLLVGYIARRIKSIHDDSQKQNNHNNGQQKKNDDLVLLKSILKDETSYPFFKFSRSVQENLNTALNLDSNFDDYSNILKSQFDVFLK